MFCLDILNFMFHVLYYNWPFSIQIFLLSQISTHCQWPMKIEANLSMRYRYEIPKNIRESHTKIATKMRTISMKEQRKRRRNSFFIVLSFVVDSK